MRIETTLPSAISQTIKTRRPSGRLFALAAGTILLGSIIAPPLQAQIAGTYTVTNLISDGSVPATTIDAGFINPWGISASGTWWINTAGTGFSYIVPGANPPTATFGTITSKVTVPAASGLTTATGQPAGIVTTGGATGMLIPLPNGAKASFLFSTLDGTISAWNSKIGTAGAVVTMLINNSAAGASYPGITIYNTATTSVILAANFGAGRAIEAYDSNFALTHLTGNFTDPNLPANYAPFSIHIINGKIYVAYAIHTATAPYGEITGTGNGILDVFDTTGAFVARAITGGNLNAPWGVAIAPANFGIFGGSLLVGNFGDGHINAYDPVTYAFRGQLADGTGKPLTYAALWELLPGQSSVTNSATPSGGDPNTVYFTAGLAAQAHGLFAAIANNPTTTGTGTFGLSAAAGAITVPDGTSVQTTISVAPTNNFSGTVNLACTGLPAGATCTFSPAQITATAAAASTSTLTITTTKSTAFLHHLRGTQTTIAAALLLPFASILAFYRRRSPLSTSPLRLLSILGIMLATLGMISGCSSSTPPTPTPTGTSQVTVTATSGAITQSTVISVTVQ